MSNKKKGAGAVVGAAFLMATSAIGPGFLTQTAVFTEKFKANLSFGIIVSILIVLVVQLNVWRIIGVSGMRGQDIANKVLPGLGYFVAFLVALGGLAFNIGNVGGAAMGIDVLFDGKINSTLAIILSGGFGACIFIFKDAGSIMDKVTKVLGIFMILIISYVTFSSKPPIGEVIAKTINPESYKALLFPVITLIGGTIGGYISFAGGHRLLDAGITGEENIKQITNSAVIGISVASLMRLLLFLAVLGVVSKGIALDPANPPASAFRAGAGVIGYKIFGLVILAAALTSIVGAAYTSVSFLKTLFPIVKQYEQAFIIGFIVTSTLIMAFIGRPVSLLIIAGSLNGIILPITLGVILLAANKKDVVGEYKHSKVLTVLGYVVVVAMGYSGIMSLKNLAALFN